MIDFAAKLLRPSRSLRIASFLQNKALFASIIFFTIGTYLAFFGSPEDYQQGANVRFMYIHVPASWLALSLYTIMAISSLVGFTIKIPTAHILTRALALPGCLFTGISLVTGALWGKVTWGTYWVWDARLTSMLILFFIYMGYVSMTWKKPLSSLHSASVLVLIGFINIPIIKWSVDFWFTLHQPASIMRFAKSAIDPAFLPPLFCMTLGYLFYAMALSAFIYKRDLLKEQRHLKEQQKFQYQEAA